LALAFEKQDKLSEATEQIQAALVLDPINSEYIEERDLILQKRK
jgi:hypothetical protein